MRQNIYTLDLRRRLRIAIELESRAVGHERHGDTRPPLTLPPSPPAAAIRDHIREIAGLLVTIGIARVRTLAKLFSDTGKPFGAVAVVSREYKRQLLSQLPVTEISGIAGRRAAKLLPNGIRPCLDLADVPGHLVRQFLTKTGYELWLELRGEPVAPIRAERPAHKNLARDRSRMGNVSDPKLGYVVWTRGRHSG